MPDVNLTDLAGRLLSPAVQKRSEQDFEQAYRAFLSFFRGLPTFAVYADAAGANAGNSVFLLRAVLNRAQFTGKTVTLLFDKSDAGLCGRLSESLPFFDRDKPFTLQGCRISPLDKSAADSLDAPLVLCGGAEQFDPAWEKLGLKVRYLLCAQPYASDELSFLLIREPKENEWLTFLIDIISVHQFFAERPYRIELEKTWKIPGDVKQWWAKRHKNLSACESLLAQKGNAVLVTVTGLAASSSALDRGDNIALLLALSALQSTRAGGRPMIISFLDYAKTSDSHFDLLRLFTKTQPAEWLKGLKEKYPQAAEASLKAGLYDPLLKLRAALPGKLANLVFTDTVPAAPENGRVYILPLGALPGDYIAALFAASSFLFFERQELTPLALNLGIPYLQKSIDAAADNYPDLDNPKAAQKMESLCEIFRYDIAAYTSALNKSLAEEARRLSDFFANPDKAYFQKLRAVAQDARNDKLAACAEVFVHFKAEMEGGERDAASGSILSLYELLRGAYDRSSGTLNLTKSLGSLRAAAYFSSLAGGGEFVLTLPSIDSIVLHDESHYTSDPVFEPQPVDVEIQNAAWSGGELTVKFADWYGGENLCVFMEGSFSGAASLFGIDWIKLENASFTVIAPEDGSPIKGSVGGTLAGTTLQLVVELNAQDGVHRVMAQCETPLTALQAVYAIAGGVDFTAAMPKPLRDIGGFGLQSMEFYYNEVTAALSAMNFVLMTGSPWVLWERGGAALLTASPTVSVTICAPADLANRRIVLGIGACVGLGVSGEVGTLWLGGTCPPFTAELRLVSEKLSLKGLLGLFHVDLDFECDITALRIFADFTNSVYQISAAVETDWEIVKGKFAVTGLGLSLTDCAGNFTAAFAGSLLLFGTVSLGAAVSYARGDWLLTAKAALGGHVRMNDLLRQYFWRTSMENGSSDNPGLANVGISITKHKSGGTDWEIAALAENWSISVLELTVEYASARVGMANGALGASLSAQISFMGAQIGLSLIYAQTGKSFALRWGSFTGEIRSDGGETRASLILRDCSVGELVSTLVGFCAGSPLTLDPPWDALNALKMKELTLVYNFTKKNISFTVDASLDLGFLKIDGVTVRYDNSAKEKVQVTITGAFPWQGGDTLAWDAAQPGTAPAPDGKGNKYFDLRLLVLGQKLRFFESGENPANVEQAMTLLQNKITPDSPPPYDKNAGWLIAANFGILKESGGEYFIDAALVFYEPSLFALRIKLAGATAKIFAGFSFEILYAKLSETFGVYKGTLALPSRFRRFDLGAFSVTLPDFYAEIYTDGSFYIDIGFPHQGDFSRSFTLEGIIPPGLPVVGSAGLYFGKLSAAAASSRVASLPATSDGLFSPVVVFGVGIRFGLGKSISYGILSGGFSLTLQVIMEGVSAKWCPYDPQNISEDTSWFWHLHGAAAIVGNIYGSIDFAIISASVNISIGLSVDFVYETCRAVALTIEAWVTASAALTINFGIFKISIGFHFSIKVKESMMLGEDTHAPWDRNRLPESLFLFEKSAPILMNFGNLTNDGKTADLRALMALPLTAAGDEWRQGGALVLGSLLLILKSDDFPILAEKLIFWVTAAGQKSPLTCGELLSTTVSDDYFAGIEAHLECSEGGALPIARRDAEDFLERFFRLHVQDNAAEHANLAEGEFSAGVYFPLPPGTELRAGAAGQSAYGYTLSEYNRVSGAALQCLRGIFDELAVMAGSGKQLCAASHDAISLGTWVFCDWFLLLARQSVRALRQALRGMGREAADFSSVLGAVKRGRLFDDLAGIVSRYNLHGLRLPTSASGATLITPLSEAGLWVKRRGGDLVLPPEAGLFALTGQAFAIPGDVRTAYEITPVSHSPYFSLPKGFALSINPRDGSADTVARLQKYIDTQSFAIVQSVQAEHAAFSPAIISFNAPAGQENGGKLWEVPAALAAYLGAKAEPRFGLYLTSFDASGAHKRPLAYTPLALLAFKITPAAKGAYIIGSAAEQCGALLLRILRVLDNNSGFVKGVSLLGAPGAFLAVSQSNLSTETRPPDRLQKAAAQPCRAMLDLLWKAFVTNNGGYVLTCRGVGPLPEGEVTLALALNTRGFYDENAALINAVLADDAPEAGETLVAFAEGCAQSARFAGTPETFAREYCCDMISLTELNSNIPLSSDVSWDFSNLAYQADAAVPPCCEVSRIAAYFGVSEDAIRKANPRKAIGASLANGEAIALPKFSARPGNGETLRAFSARYFAEPSALLWLNRRKTGLFLRGTVLRVNVLAGSRVGAGSENTSSLINESYRILRAAPPGLPAPGAPSYADAMLQNNFTLLSFSVNGTGDFPASGGSMPAAPDESREVIGVAEKDLRYNVVMPAGRYAGGAYSAAGRLLQNRFEWLDYYGNLLPRAFFSARICGYQDELLGVGKWKSVGAGWCLERGALTLSLHFAAQDYVNRAAAETALPFYAFLLGQMQDSRVSFTLQCSLFTKPLPFSKIGVLAWLEEIAAFLRDSSRTPPGGLVTRFPLSASGLNEAPFFPLRAEIVVEREGFAAAGYCEVPNLLRASSAIPLPGDLRTFARRFQEALPRLFILKSGGATPVYVLDISRVHAAVNGESDVFLPRPICNEPQSRDNVPIRQYRDGGFAETAFKSYRGVDMNLWLKTALSLLDAALTPAVLSASRVAGAGSDAFLTKKRAIAEKLKCLLCDAFIGGSGGDICKAREAFLQKLLGSLSGLYRVKAVVTVPLRVDAPTLPGKSRFYGSLDFQDGAACPEITLSAPKLAIPASAAEAQQTLTFAVMGEDVILDGSGAVLPHIILPLSYHASHIEADIAAARDGFEQSSWLCGVTGNIFTLPLPQNFDIPLPLYSYPETPVMSAQAAADADKPFDWKYAFTYGLSHHYPQSICHCKVRYNSFNRQKAAHKNDVFAALAQISETGAAVIAALNNLAGRVNEADAPAPEDLKAFCKAFDCALELAELLADADFGGTEAALCRNGGQEISFAVKEGIQDGNLRVDIEPRECDILPRIAGYNAEPVPKERNAWVFKDAGGLYLTAAEGQRLRERTLLLPPFPVLARQNAAAEMYLEQNAGLCENKTMNPCFVFTTGSAAFGAPLPALREFMEPVNMAAYATNPDKKHMLSEYLTDFLQAAAGAQEVALTAVLRHAVRLSPSLTATIQPIFTQTPVTVRNGDFSALTGENGTWIAALRQWRKAFPSPLWQDSEALMLSVTFFSTKTEGKAPLLTLGNIYLSGEDIAG